MGGLKLYFRFSAHIFHFVLFRVSHTGNKLPFPKNYLMVALCFELLSLARIKTIKGDRQ